MGVSPRKAAAAALVSGGGLTVLTGASIGLVVAEAKLARKAIGRAEAIPPRADGLFGAHLAWAAERPLRFAVLGDSTAAGYGVELPEETPGSLLAGALVAHTGRPVLLTNQARVGARSDRLAEQVDEVLADEENLPQLAAIMIGANDITHRAPIAEAAAALGEAVERLRAAGCEVVVGTCPDLGTIRPVQPPLRWLARHWSRKLALLQSQAVTAAGGCSVPIGALLGPEFASRAELFGPDRFHPSAEGYATAVAALLPTLASAAWRLTPRTAIGLAVIDSPEVPQTTSAPAAVPSTALSAVPPADPTDVADRADPATPVAPTPLVRPAPAHPGFPHPSSLTDR